ncbi:hypothetical protein KSS87_021476 [Heliosperma pusillum]|nr:hypothetical protein KSS87_021476 [Heliosperma pusillum]
MEDELISLYEAAKRAADVAMSEVDDAASETRCLDALNHLKLFPVNYQILVSTQPCHYFQLLLAIIIPTPAAAVPTPAITVDHCLELYVNLQVGKRLRHLTKHPKTKIQSVAADLIDVWKNIIIQETAQKKNGSSSCNNSVKGEPLKAVTTKKQMQVKSEKPSKGEPINVEKIEKDFSLRPHKLAKTETGSVERKIESNSPKAEPVRKPTANSVPKLPSMVLTHDAMRDKVREMLVEALSKVPSEVDDSIKQEIEACDPIRVAVKVESVMFENWGRSTGAHKFKYRSIMFNIRDPNNPDFRRKVLLGEVDSQKICNLKTDEMASEQRRQEKKEIEEKKLFDCERGAAPKATTDQFRCARCGQRKCTYYQLQTRSADEPMTTFVTCVNCNNHWKFC